MECEQVRQAVERLQQQGVPLEKISAPQVRQLTGSGSYRDITKHLRELRGGDPSGREADDDAAGDPPADGDAGAVPADPVQEAGQALTHAQQQLSSTQSKIAPREHALAEARQRRHRADAGRRGGAHAGVAVR